MWTDIFCEQSACGFEYTSKLQRMFQDIGLSKDLNEDFKKHLGNLNVHLEGNLCIQKDFD